MTETIQQQKGEPATVQPDWWDVEATIRLYWLRSGLWVAIDDANPVLRGWGATPMAALEELSEQGAWSPNRPATQV